MNHSVHLSGQRHPRCSWLILIAGWLCFVRLHGHLNISSSTAFVALKKLFLRNFFNPDFVVTVTYEVPIGILHKIGEGLSVRLMANG